MRLKLSLITLLGVLFAFSCSVGETFAPKFSVDITADSFPGAGGSKTISLTSNVSWNATSSQSWLTVTPTSGGGDASLTLTATENGSPASRTAVVTLTPSEGNVITINISQNTNYQFSVDVLEVVMESGTQEAKVSLRSRTGWKATSSEEWLKVSPGSGTGDAELKLTASVYEDGPQRTATVTLRPDIGEAIEVEVIQMGVSFTVDEMSIEITSSPQDKVIVLRTNMPWTALSSADWLTVSPNEGEEDAEGSEGQEITLTVTRNSASSERVAKVTITPEMGKVLEVEITQGPSETFSDQTWYVAPGARGNASGNSKDNAADFLREDFWNKINNELKTKSVEVIFLDGDYSRAYISGGKGLALDRLGNENHRLTLTGGKDVVFRPLEGYPIRATLIRMHGSQNIHFRDFMFTGDGELYFALAIRSPEGFPKSKNILVENCTWIDMKGLVYGATGCHYDGTTDITYKDCKFIRIGKDSGSHMIYNGYSLQRIKIVDCYFEDCTGDYVRFRDRTGHAIVKNSTFVRNVAYPDYVFISIPIFNDVDPGDEYFGNDFVFIDNEFINNAYENTSRAISFVHRGYSSPGYKFLPTRAEVNIMQNGAKKEKLEQFKINFGIDLEKVRITGNNFSNRITHQMVVNTSAAFGAVGNGWAGSLDISGLINNNTTPFDWEDTW